MSWWRAARNRRSIVSRLAGFAACRALSTDSMITRSSASRPYDKDRDGFVMGEGAGAVVLEEFEHAKRRGANIYGELIGYGLSGDAYHITAPAEDGDGAYRCMKTALKRARFRRPTIDYINAHGTSTPSAMRSSSKPSSAWSAMPSVRQHVLDQILDRSSARCGRRRRGDLLPARDPRSSRAADHQFRQSVGRNRLSISCRTRRENAPINIALSNSFGFGGTNASLIFRRMPDERP